MAFSQAQAVALFGQRTSVIVNSGALGIVATAIGTSVANPNEMLPATGLFLLGFFFAVVSCFASYFNLSTHSEYYELKATEEALRANQSVSNDIEKKTIDEDMVDNAWNLTMAAGKIGLTFWVSFSALLFSFLCFFLACLMISETSLF